MYKKRSAAYDTWANMKQRCNNKNHPDYKNYGGRGIKVVDRWSMFANFLEDMGDKPSGLELDRINNEGDYCKENCHWVSDLENQRNKRDVVRVEFGGRMLRLAEIAEESGLKAKTIWNRYARGDRGADLVRPLQTKIRRTK